MCIFRKKLELEPEIEEEILVLPHPEEPVNYNCTMENYNLDLIFQKWFEDYLVPLEYRDFWRNQINVTVTLELLNYQLPPIPAWTWEEDEQLYMKIRPEWLNVGVLSHEFAHSSYKLLSNTEKQLFTIKFEQAKNTDKLVQYLFKEKPYGLSNDIEGHADLYRYLGQSIPETLKPFYPKLFV